jgi:hypothetical protein
MHTVPSVDPRADLSSRILALPLGALRAALVDLAPFGWGMPSGSVEFSKASLVIGATVCSAPMFRDTITTVANRRHGDVLLVRTGFHPETLNEVTSDVALFASGDVLLLPDMLLYRGLDHRLWLVSPDDRVFVEICAAGLRLRIQPPFFSEAERGDGLCRAAREIVYIATRRGER